MNAPTIRITARRITIVGEKTHEISVEVDCESDIAREVIPSKIIEIAQGLSLAAMGKIEVPLEE